MNKSKLFLLPVLLLVLSSCNKVDTDKIRSEGYKEGYNAGHTTGLEEGEKIGYENGYKDGYKEGKDDGYNDGYKKGFSDGTTAGSEEAYTNGYKAGYEQGYNDAMEEVKQNFNPGKNLSIHTIKQKDYIKDNYSNIGKYASGARELSIPEPIKLEFNSYESPSDATFTIKVSENEDLTDAWIFKTKETSFDLYNCKVNTTYYWKVTEVNDVPQYLAPLYKFSTEDTVLRNLYIDGITNARDMGGYTLNDERVIKQGLIYRTAGLDWVAGSDTITPPSEKALDTLKNQLGIKTEIDLANRGQITGITKILCKMDPNISNQLDIQTNGEAIKNVFKSLADINNYPTVFHCTRGRDRTGAIAFLLGSLLGMNDNDLCRDYLFTNFALDCVCNITPINTYKSILNTYSGSTMKEQASNYLKAIGVTQDEIDSIRSILIA